jgi:hypothetical protein
MANWVSFMISLKSILEGEINVDNITFKQKDAGGFRPSYQNTKLVKHTLGLSAPLHFVDVHNSLS